MANMTFKTNLLPNSTTQEYSLGSSTNKWKIYGDLIGNAEKVTQNNQDGAAEYRVLLSGSANDTNEFNVTNKSGNLTFNPSTKLLSIGGGITATGDLTLTGNAHLNNETYAENLTAGSLLITGNSNFTQIPTAPTPEDTSDDTSIATTAFVKKAFSYNDAMVFMGAIPGGSSMPAANKGHTYRVSLAGQINGQNVEVGDTLICTEDNTAAGNTTNWIILQTNIDGAVVGPASSTAGHIATFTGTTGKAIKDSGFTIATSVPGNAVFTDTKVTQGTTTSSNWRKILLNGGSGTIYSAWNTEVGNDVTDIAYRTLGVSVQPSTNTLKANNLYAARAFNNLITGTGTAAKDNGSGNNRYMPAKWTFDTGANVTDGDTFLIKIPVAGHDYGVFMSVNNGTNYYPVVTNGTTRVTRHYPANTYLQVVFESTGSAASMFPVAGGTSRVTVSNGVFRVINYYDSNSNDTGYYHRKIYPNLKAGANKIFPYTLIMQNKDGRWESIVTSSSTGTSKAKNAHGFLLEQVWCMYANTTYNENGNVGTYNIWTAHSGLIDMRYSINVTTSSGMTGYKPVYLVGTIGTDGLFYLADTWWSQTLPTTDDGKVYIYIGDAYDAYRLTLSEVNTAYFFRDNRLQMYGSGRGVKGISRSGTTFTVTRDDGSTFTFTQQDNNSVTGVKGNAESSYRTGNVNLTPANIGAVNKAGDTMTGVLTALGSQYTDSYSGALNMNNSNIYGLNSIYTVDTSDNAAEGIHFYRDSTHVDTLWMNGGDLLFVPNRALGTSTTKDNSQKVGRFTANPTSGQVVITDGTTGGMKSSGFTIAASVPSGAKFTDTTYTANNGVSLSGTTFSNSGVRAATINGNYLRVNTNGTNADLTIPYATESKKAANTQSNFGAKSFIVEGDADTYYPTLFTGYTAHNAWTLLNISRGYSEQAPDTWNTSTHRGGLTLTILSNGDTSCGGNHSIGVTKLNTIFDLSQDYCTMVGDIECTNFGLVIWLRGGTAKYWVTSNGGHEVSVTTYYESHTQSSNTVAPITTVNTSRINSYRWNNLWNINTANKLKTARTIQTNLASTSSASFDGSDNITPGVVGTLPIANGGTGATTAANARINLGLGTMATETAANYLKLSGGTMTGSIKFPTETAAFTNGIRFLNSTTEKGSIGVDNNGCIGIYGSTKISLRPVLNAATDGVEITTSSMIPTKNNTVSLGTSSNKWSNVYATTFHGALDGNASTATKATQDESGNNIKASYASSFSISEHTITLKNKNGESLGSVTVPNYTFTNGNGSFTITSSEGNVQTVSIGKPATAGVADSANSVAWGNVTGKPSSYTPSSHSHSEIVTVGDKRSEATTPNSYANKIIFQGLKTNSSFGSPSTDSYSYVIGLRGWSDSSGGDSHELAFNNTGLYWRHGATTSWGSWNRIYTTANKPTKSDVGLGNVENTTLSTWAGSSNITTIGTLSSGTVPWARLSGVPAGASKEGTVTSITAGTGLNTTSNDTTTDGGTISTSGTLYLTKSGATAGSYGPSANVTGTEGTTMSVPYITVDKYGRVTSISNKTYTAKNTTYTLAGLMGSTAIGSSTKPVYWTGSAFAGISSYEGKAATAGVADKISNLTSTDNASSTTGWRNVWMSYSDGVTGRPALSTALTFQTSTGTLKATKFSGDGSSLTALNASNLSSGTVAFARLPSMYWSNIAITSTATYNAAPEMATIKLNGNTSASTATTANNVTLVYDTTLQALDFVFA